MSTKLGRPKKFNNAKILGIHIEEELFIKLNEHCVKNNMERSNLINKIITDYLNKNNE